METFFNSNSIICIVLIIFSLPACIWCLYQYFTVEKKEWVYLLEVVVVFLIIGLCAKNLESNYQFAYLYDKLLRPTKSYYLNELNLSPEECREDFEEIAEIVLDNYSPMARHKGIDLKKMNAKYRKEVETVENVQQYGLLLLHYFSELRNMHSHPLFSQYLSDISLVGRNDSVWISRNYNKQVNLKERDLVLAINGVATEDYIQEQMNYISASTDWAKRKYALRNDVLSSYTDTCKLLMIQRGDSVLEVLVPLHRIEEAENKHSVNEKTVRADSLQTRSQDFDDAWYLLVSKLCKLEGNIGYIRIPDFKLGSVERFKKQVNKEFEYPYLILDLKGNLGGRKDYVMNVASYLITHSVNMGDISVKSDTARCYKGKLFVLIDGYTSSGGEFLAAMLKGQPNVVLLGQRTGGDCGNLCYYFKTTHGIEFRLETQAPFLLPDGVTWSEGEGITPDVTVEEYLPWEDGKGSLAVALELIKKDELRGDTLQK